MSTVPAGHLARGGALRLAAVVEHDECGLCHKPFSGARTAEYCTPCRESPEGREYIRMKRQAWLRNWRAKKKEAK